MLKQKTLDGSSDIERTVQYPIGAIESDGEESHWLWKNPESSLTNVYSAVLLRTR